MRSVGRSRSVEGDYLVPKDIVARRDILREPEQPAVVVLRHGIPTPHVRGFVYEADLVDLEELQFSLVDGVLGVAAKLSTTSNHKPTSFLKGS